MDYKICLTQLKPEDKKFKWIMGMQLGVEDYERRDNQVEYIYFSVILSVIAFRG